MSEVTNLLDKRKTLNAKASGKAGAESYDPFVCSDDGVWYFGGRDSQGNPLPGQRICAKLEVTARCREFDGNGWGYVLVFSDPRGHVKQWVLPSRLLAGDGAEFRAALMAMGLDVSVKPLMRSRLAEYIQSRKPDAYARTTDRVGWQLGGAFVLPDRTIGEGEERIIFQSDGAVPNTFKQQGDVAAWRDAIARRCAGNSRLVFALSCAFAGPLLHLVGVDSGGFHYRGDSSTGKTTALRVAASAWGGNDFMQRWKTTDNALESTAAQHCDVTLILDEIAQLEAAKAGDVAYLLANESGKARAKQSGSARARLSWRLLFLSAGEIGLADHVAESGKRVHTGQEVRMVDLPADAGGGLGMFEVLHEFAGKGGAAFADAIKADAAKHYGAAGIEFLAKLTQDADAIAERSKRAVAALASQWASGSSSGQVARVARRFALVAVAGELSAEFEISGWLPQEATICTKVMFDAWIESRGGTGDGERARMLNQVRTFIEAHGSARFAWWHRANDDHAPNTMYRAGFKRMIDTNGKPCEEPVGEMSKAAFGDGMIEFFILPGVFRDEICKGYDYKAVCRLLIELGHLANDKGRLDARGRLPGMPQTTTYYRILPSIFDHGDD
jgi:putative DNA primase/helicase